MKQTIGEQCKNSMILLPGQWWASMGMTWRVEEEPEEGEMREMECQVPMGSRRRRERLKPGNLKGKSLAVSREQKIGPLAQLEDNPWVWSECRCVKKYAWLCPVHLSTDIRPFSISTESLREREREREVSVVLVLGGEIGCFLNFKRFWIL